MGRAKGAPKTGGRKAGTPNKVTKEIKEWINDILTNGRARFETSLMDITPEDYIKTYMGLMNYVTPKMQAISLDATLEAEYKNLERLLDIAPKEVVDEIAKRVVELQNKAGKANG